MSTMVRCHDHQVLYDVEFSECPKCAALIKRMPSCSRPHNANRKLPDANPDALMGKGDEEKKANA